MSTASSPARLQPGDAAPEFELLDAEGRKVSLASLRGSRVVLYFYPEAATPACTTQACDFRDSLASLRAEGLEVVGVSRDEPAKLARFAAEERIPFTLLSDPERAVHEAYGTWGEKQLYGKTVTGVIRSTFVIDAEGRIEHTFYNTRATGHVSMLRKRLGIAV
ncbi:thioredoxin-dependent thiol peroxidase [Homoserinibacter sp. YIM 151385]|uniref:thioredoxin-dependent thiol peroxidase n=1 Tax=Homoserinibacter sp. YIM 151385 TaxID=2985506 RepID=UPI0022F0ED8D|nr:thioredoxin-dependent thiol peroxidase [Homoserinibacter sp. YIM 151385]WBU37825.1 thioredoxin-dependent thiol peroxidase [Homoserinibacter sp. YIM 151385]